MCPDQDCIFLKIDVMCTHDSELSLQIFLFRRYYIQYLKERTNHYYLVKRRYIPFLKVYLQGKNDFAEVEESQILLGLFKSFLKKICNKK